MTHLQPTTSSAFHRRLLRAHTLVELLVVIAVLSALTATALVAYNGHLRDAALEMMNRRNAQEIAAECQRAEASGVDVFGGGSVEAAILNLIDGVVATDGPFRGRAFKVILPSVEDYQGAMNHLDRRGTTVLYLPE